MTRTFRQFDTRSPTSPPDIGALGNFSILFDWRKWSKGRKKTIFASLIHGESGPQTPSESAWPLIYDNESLVYFLYIAVFSKKINDWN